MRKGFNSLKSGDPIDGATVDGAAYDALVFQLTRLICTSRACGYVLTKRQQRNFEQVSDFVKPLCRIDGRADAFGQALRFARYVRSHDILRF
jgi:hypothetical protein